jgi:proline iminopeptidase
MRAPCVLAALSAGLVSCASATPGAVTPASSLAPLAQGDHHVDVHGHAIAYHVYGHGPFCIAHPGGPGIEWAYLRMPEVEAGLTVVYLEPIGTGASARLASPAEYTMVRYTEELEGFRQAIGLEKTCLIGHSHGGFVAQRYALAHPDRLTALVLYDTAPRVDADFAKSMQAHAKELSGARPWFTEAMAGMAGEDTAKTDEELTATIAREMPLYFADFDAHRDEYRAKLAGARATLAPSRANDPVPFDTRAELPKLSVPTLIVVGRRDFICSVPFAEEMHRGIPRSELMVLEQSGHFGHIEEPAAFSAAVVRFVASK